MSLLSRLLVSVLLALSQAEQGVFVRGPLELESVPALPLAAPEKSAGAVAIWAWSPLCPPRRFEPQARVACGGPGVEEGRPLRVRVPAAREPWAGRLRLIAAPVEMWEEVPEPLLPSWPVPPSGRLEIPADGRRAWRLRVTGEGAGSVWIDLSVGAPGALIPVVRAAGARSRLVAPGGRAVAGSSVRILENGAGRLGGGRSWAWVLGDAQGRFALPGLPDRDDLTWLAAAEGHPPTLLASAPSRLPPEIEMRDGALVRGQVVGPDGKPLEGARVLIESWATPEAPIPFQVREETDSRGVFSARAVPPGPAVLVVLHEGWAEERHRIAVPPEGLDAGVLALSRGTSLVVQAVDDTGQAIAGAEIRAGLSAQALTDRNGVARLEALPLHEPIRLEGRAAGHLPAELRVLPPAGGAVEIRLERAFEVRGYFLSRGSAPFASASVQVARGRTFDTERVEADGAFTLALHPGEDYGLRFVAPQSRPLELAVKAGAPGESRDLGSLAPPAGGTVSGRLVDGATGEPVPGGRIWAPRPSPKGPLIAWMERDLVEAVSGPDGRFHLAGLPEGPGTLRIEAAGYARQRRAVEVPAEGESALGDLAVSAGTALVILTGAQGEGGLAAVVPGSGGLPVDRLQAPVRDGQARIAPVQPGPVRISVERGAELLCEKVVDVPPQEADFTVECPAERRIVQGAVKLGPNTAGAGTLIWQTEAGPLPEGILTHRSPNGLTQQQVYSANAPPVRVPVDSRGAFLTHQLRSGTWEVQFQPEAGGTTEPLRIVLAAAAHQAVDLSFPGHSLTGTVAGEGGEPVEGARVRELEGGTTTYTGRGGEFRFDGLRAKSYTLRAQKDERESEPLAIALGGREPQGPVVLILREGARKPALAVSVLDASGAPAAGTFVFVELSGRGMRVLTTGSDGRADLLLDPPYPAAVRVAALLGNVWTLGDWVRWEEAGEGLTLAASGRRTGTLEIQPGTASGLLQIEAPGGWSLTALLTTLGSPPLLEPGSTLRVSGVPAGVYQLRAGREVQPAAVREDSTTAIALGARRPPAPQ